MKRNHRGYGDTFYIDEVFVKINGEQHYLWRAVDQDGEVVDVYLQARRDGAAAKRFFKRLLRTHGTAPRKIVTDKVRSYGVAHRELMPEAIRSTEQYENNRAEQSHEATRVRERGMRKFKSVRQAQRFLGAYAALDICLSRLHPQSTLSTIAPLQTGQALIGPDLIMAGVAQ